MGTNYYLHRAGTPQPPCEACGRPYEAEEPLHIGKSSVGWCFSLHVHPELGIYNLEDWQRVWKESGAQIVNEYGDPVAPDEMTAEIVLRGCDRPPPSAAWHAENEAVPGPNNLARHRLGGPSGMRTVRHGAGTWDCIEGEFS